MKQLFLVLLLTSLTTSSAFLQKQLVDRDAKGLKGNVKSVDTAVSVINPSSESKRQPTGREEFDAAGNLTVEMRYDAVTDAVAVLTYSYLDGERVVKEEIKSKRKLSAKANNGPTRPLDPPYTVKLKYKYDDVGNRIESTQMLRDGSTSLRQVYTFSANEREEQQYSANGSLTYKFVHKLDDKRNEVETVTTRYEGSRDPVKGTTAYKYLEFDSQGNWTKRIESRGGDSWMIYRTITYNK